MRRGGFVLMMILGPFAALASADAPPSVDELRAQLEKLGRYVLEENDGKAPAVESTQKISPRQQTLVQFARSPRMEVRAAIDKALKEGSKEERTGALHL